MNVDQLKIRLELQALQKFNSSQAPADTSQMFEILLNNLISDNVIQPSPTENVLITKRKGQTENKASRLMNNPAMPPYMLTKSLGYGHQSPFDNIIQEASELYDLPTKLLKSVIKQESNFNPDAVSSSGASGLMQLMPETAKSLGVKNIFDPKENIYGGAKYLRQMLNRFDENIELALAAYNAGPGNIDKYSGIPPFKETINYVKNIKRSLLV